MKNPKLIVQATLAAMLLTIVGCGQRESKMVEPLGTSEIKFGKSEFPVKVMPLDAPLNITSVHMTNVPYSLAESKALQALANYDVEQSKKFGYDFPISTVWQPEAFNEQVIDGHMYWVALLGYHNANQAAYRATGGICPGIVVVDAEDESKPAQVRLSKPDGTPYKIQLHYRDTNWDHKYIYRFLYREAGYDVTNSDGFVNLDQQPQRYLDDVTPEVEDGTWRVYYTGTYNVCSVRLGTVGAWRFPKVEEFFLIDSETKDIKRMKPEEAPGWVDRIYSEHLVAEMINNWGYDLRNWGLNSQRGRLVLDENRLETVLDAKGHVLQYVGLVTSSFADDSALGVMIVPTRDLHGYFYPLYGDRALATQYHAMQVINDALKYRGYEVDDLTLHFLYGHPTWEGSLLMNVQFHEQGEEGVNTEGDHSKTGTTYAGCVLLSATCDVNVDDVVWDESKQVAFDKYEQHLFSRQTSNTGSYVLQETEAVGTVASITEHSEHGDSMYILTLQEPQFKGLLFRVAPRSTYDREFVDILGTVVGDKVSFVYGDTKTSPTCFVKKFRNNTHPQGGGSLR